MEGTESSRGMNFRALETLFALRAERTDTKYDIGVSMLEIYNEAIRDMLVSRPRGEAPVKLTAREGAQGVYVQDLTVRPVASLDNVLAIMREGYSSRKTFATNMNEHSSRSHCLMSVHVAGTNRVTGATVRGKLHLIDLAGSERIAKSGATGDRLKEAQAINKSLSALGDVIAARMEKRGHVPFRNSTLTWVLSDALSGDSKTLMFVNLSPILSSAEESLCSLNFAARAATVEMGKATRHGAGGSGGAPPPPLHDDDADAADAVGFGDDGEDAAAAEAPAAAAAAAAAAAPRRGSAARVAVPAPGRR